MLVKPFVTIAVVLCAALFCGASLVGCGGSRRPSAGTVGPGGGIVELISGPLAGTRVEVPPGAVTGPVAITIEEAQPTTIHGQMVIGPAVQLGPEGLQFQKTVAVSLPFDPDKLPWYVDTGEFQVQVRESSGQLTEQTPVFLVYGNRRVTVNLLHFSTLWVTFPDYFESWTYFPLVAGSRYEFDDPTKLVITVERPLDEPNIPHFGLAKVLFDSAIDTRGLYFVPSIEGGLYLAGEFVPEVYQEILGAKLFDVSQRIPGRNETSYFYDGYVPFGFQFPAYLGEATTVSEIVQRTSITTPLGTFDDVIEVSWTTTGRGQRATALDEMRLWLAREVGPVRVEFGGQVAQLVSGTLGDQPITAK